MHKYQTLSDFNADYNGSAYHEPWVSYETESGTVAYNKIVLPEVRVNTYTAEYTYGPGSFYETEEEFNLAKELVSTAATTYFGTMVSSSTTQNGYTAVYSANRSFKIRYEDSEYGSLSETVVEQGDTWNVEFEDTSDEPAHSSGDFNYTVTFADNSYAIQSKVDGSWFGITGAGASSL